MSSSRVEPRVRCVLPVKVAGTDSAGNRFERLTCTLDISDRGVRITGVPDTLSQGMEVDVIYKSRRAAFRVAWVGRAGTRTEGQIGLLSDAGKAQFWPELRQQQSNVEDYAARERLAQQQAKMAASRVAAAPPA